MKFGLALDFATAERTMEQQLDRYLELIKLAERYGFDSVTAGETYPNRPSSGHVPSPLLVLAALAPRTTLRIGTGVTLLPAWHPLKLAYDSAMLDQISGGRFVLGVGVSNAALQRRFGVDTERVGDFVDDTLAALKALWNGADGFEGKYLKIQGGIGIRPLQPGGPPLIVGGTLRRSTERAAEWGDGWFASTNYPFEQVAQQAGRYRESMQRRGKEGGAVIVNRLTAVAEDESEARRVAGEYVGRALQRYARMGMMGPEPELPTLPSDQLFARSDDRWCLVGTPDQVASRIQRYADAGATQIQFRISPEETPPDLAARSVELLGSQVLPRFA